MIFESILSKAAEKRQAKEAQILAMEEQRHEEAQAMRRDAAKRRHFPSLPKRSKPDRRNGESMLDPYQKLILSESEKGASPKEIAIKLSSKGIKASPSAIFNFIAKYKRSQKK